MPSMNVNHTNLYYEVKGEGQPLVFIHGLGSSARDWEFQVPFFAQHFQVITLDLRGHGRSDKPPGPYSLPMFAADVAGLLQGLQVSSAHIVGLSLGGGIAFQLAVEIPALVRTLVIVNSAPELVVRTFKDKLAIWQRYAITRLLGLPRMGKVLSERLFPNPEHASLRAAFIERFAQNDPRAYLSATRAMVGWSVTAELGKIQCPTLIMASDHDYTPVALKEAYAAKIKNSSVVVLPNAHHAVPVECPEVFNEQLLAFLMKVQETQGSKST